MRSRVSAYAVAVMDEQLLLTQLADSSPVFEPGGDDSNGAVTWMPLSGLRESELSPAAVDRLAMTGVRWNRRPRMGAAHQ
ncbi:hypothetical protein ACFRAO_10985 [Streptomyces sp. NPDC056656]|uniref:hypothetical protein n=1 Tax=Streptomyces sp. NPDC056656 TaxID=3345895 RepID=UPI0036C1BBF0